MPRNDFLRFPSDKEAAKYQYQRTAKMVIAITACVGLCVVFLALYATLRSSLLFIAAGSSAGIAVALWYVSKRPDDETP
ncbi:MAG: hypothetical protein DI630_12535 [Gordonia sp. (in: high G+C Gram-positive bacteria)]|nr:MAG: hypothetical protein DI630_12535 [Gordonia sp. (in: high G+C Gram-positive bacteria)]